MDDDEEVRFDEPFPRPKLLHRATDIFPDGTVRETSLYRLPTAARDYWCEQVIVIDDWTVRHRVALDAKLVAAFLAHLARIVDDDAG